MFAILQLFCFVEMNSPVLSFSSNIDYLATGKSIELSCKGEIEEKNVFLSVFCG